MTTAAVPAPQRRPSSGLVSKDAPSAALEAVGIRPRRAQRRPTKPAAYELANHAKAFIEGFQCMFHLTLEVQNLICASRKCVRVPLQPAGSWYIHIYARPTTRWLPTTTLTDRARRLSRPPQIQNALKRD